MANNLLTTVMNPAAKSQIMTAEGQRQSMGIFGFQPPSTTLARRLDTLENKTVYLVDTGFGGSYKFMIQLQKWFTENMPSVTTVRKRKTGHVFMNDSDTTDLWSEVKAKGHAVVLGVAG
ncbi:MAG: hypothetical protein WC370_05615 [Dehalococcoidales bacterium]|jgi:hypothetical protein